MTANEFLTNPKVAAITAVSTISSSMIDFIYKLDSASFAAICGGILSLTLAYCHIKKMLIESKKIKLEIKVIEERHKAEIEQRLVTGQPLNRATDKINM